MLAFGLLRRVPWLAALLLALPASANDITLQGLTFSDREGGFNLLGVTGSDSLADPFVVLEEVGKAGNAILTIEGWKSSYPQGTGAQGGVSFNIRKVVINVTDKFWTSFEMELREELELPSGYLDGLSFGQPFREDRPGASDLLPQVLARDEPLDAMVFSGGEVLPEERVSFDFVITDMTPTERFYLVQRLRLDVVEAPALDAPVRAAHGRPGASGLLRQGAATPPAAGDGDKGLETAAKKD